MNQPPPPFKPKYSPTADLKERGGYVRPLGGRYGKWIARLGAKVAEGKDAREAAEKLLAKLA